MMIPVVSFEYIVLLLGQSPEQGMHTETKEIEFVGQDMLCILQ